ncbi:hypothetical protein O6H91_15G048400 [Diphasiastrum complanatum]|nr:hypothetical protein O6H91_15G048400 [Diphasiastrum complanatum]
MMGLHDLQHSILLHNNRPEEGAEEEDEGSQFLIRVREFMADADNKLLAPQVPRDPKPHYHDLYGWWQHLLSHRSAGFHEGKSAHSAPSASYLMSQLLIACFFQNKDLQSDVTKGNIWIRAKRIVARSQIFCVSEDSMLLRQPELHELQLFMPLSPPVFPNALKNDSSEDSSSSNHTDKSADTQVYQTPGDTAGWQQVRRKHASKIRKSAIVTEKQKMLQNSSRSANTDSIWLSSDDQEEKSQTNQNLNDAGLPKVDESQVLESEIDTWPENTLLNSIASGRYVRNFYAYHEYKAPNLDTLGTPSENCRDDPELPVHNYNMRKRVQTKAGKKNLARSRRRARARLASAVEGVKNPMAFQIVEEKRDAVLPKAVIEKLLARDIAMGYFGLLPSDILRDIFSQLTLTDLCLLSMTCKGINMACEDGDLWKELMRRHFPRTSPPIQTLQDWKNTYTWEQSKLLGRLQCFYTKRTIKEDILGFPVGFTRDPENYSIDQMTISFNLMSAKAFFKHKIRVIENDMKISFLLPLYINEDHFDRSTPLLKRTAIALSPLWTSTIIERDQVIKFMSKLRKGLRVKMSDNQELLPKGMQHKAIARSIACSLISLINFILS